MRTEKISVYLQIVDDIKRRVELGLLAADEKLPSCRELAIKLGINPNTVQRAYATLEEEGFIYTVPKKGVYVSPDDKKSYLEQVAKQKLTELKSAGISRERISALIEEIYAEGEKND